MCGHYAGMGIDEDISADELISQFTNALHVPAPDEDDIPVLCIYNGGSFFNSAEIPYSAQQEICNRVGLMPKIRKVVFESKVDYLDEFRLIELKRHLKEKELVIAVGLETIDDGVRDLSINKGVTLSRFLKGIEIIQRVGRLRVYLFLSPPFLTETESIEDIVESIRFVANLGAEAIHIEAMTIQRHTLSYYLYQQDLCRSPWLWSIIEVLRRVDPIPVYVSPFAHYPRPIRIPENCPNCTDRVRSILLEEYNRTYDIGVFKDLTCACQEEWKKDLERIDDRSLEQRVIDGTKSTLELLSKGQSFQANLLSLHERQITPNK